MNHANHHESNRPNRTSLVPFLCLCSPCHMKPPKSFIPDSFKADESEQSLVINKISRVPSSFRPDAPRTKSLNVSEPILFPGFSTRY